jgi:EpsI family protein
MGKKKTKHIIIVIIFLALACFGVYFKSDKKIVAKQVSLQSFLQNIPEYTFLDQNPLEENIISTLELDDYANTSYRKGDHIIGLYIGYYFSQAKVSAAHSPLVCFPGNGWQVADKKKSHFLVGPHEINYEQFIARNGPQKLLVMYWFQAHEKTSSDIFLNKINAITNQLTGKKQEHAFVRVTVPLTNLTRDDARHIGENFIKQFYPVFLDYINN